MSSNIHALEKLLFCYLNPSSQKHFPSENILIIFENNFLKINNFILYLMLNYTFYDRNLCSQSHFCNNLSQHISIFHNSIFDLEGIDTSFLNSRVLFLLDNLQNLCSFDQKILYVVQPIQCLLKILHLKHFHSIV